MTEKTISVEQKIGCTAGARFAEGVISGLKAEPISDQAFEAFLLNLNAGLMGYAAGRLGHDRARALAAAMASTVEKGIAIISEGAPSRVQ
ncbi:hypothetical protein [Fulvimonas yonginensis]|uniref:Uncharacterized protein n=1 Tax=Fulvimonas yonginensis TaxID=1495200 RepID=A0ABU8JAB0_9GAMM